MYRYQDGWYSEDPLLVVCHIVRITRKGCWVKCPDEYDRERFILDGATKQYAHPTKAAAWTSYVYRCRRRVVILGTQLATAKERLATAENLMPDGSVRWKP